MRMRRSIVCRKIGRGIPCEWSLENRRGCKHTLERDHLGEPVFSGGYKLSTFDASTEMIHHRGVLVCGVEFENLLFLRAAVGVFPGTNRTDIGDGFRARSR